MATRTKFKTRFTPTDDALRDQPPPGNRRIVVPPTGPGERPVGLGDARARGLDRVAEVRGAGQDAINRLAAQVQSWLEEMDPLGKTRFAKTNPAGLALQWTEPPG